MFDLFCFYTVHKYYVSVIQIDYLETKQSVQIITRIFTDDFDRFKEKGNK